MLSLRLALNCPAVEHLLLQQGDKEFTTLLLRKYVIDDFIVLYSFKLHYCSLCIHQAILNIIEKTKFNFINLSFKYFWLIIFPFYIFQDRRVAAALAAAPLPRKLTLTEPQEFRLETNDRGLAHRALLEQVPWIKFIIIFLFKIFFVIIESYIFFYLKFHLNNRRQHLSKFHKTFCCGTSCKNLLQNKGGKGRKYSIFVHSPRCCYDEKFNPHNF